MTKLSDTQLVILSAAAKSEPVMFAAKTIPQRRAVREKRSRVGLARTGSTTLIVFSVNNCSPDM